MAIIERIVTVYNDKGSKQALKDLNRLEESFINASKNIGKAFGAAALAAGAFATKLAVDGVQAAISDQKSQALLANSLRNTVNATDAAILSVENYISSTQKLVSVSDDELRPSLITLLNATKDLNDAQALQSLALDISAGSSKDLQTVSMALSRAVGGNIGALSRLGITLSDDIRKSKDINAALKELAATFSGAASKRAETFEFRMQGIRIAFTEILETLGYALIPVLEDLASTFQTELLPVFEQFIATNKDQIAQTFKDVLEFAIGATKGLASMFKTISDNLTTFKIFAGILTGLFVGTKIYAGIQLVISALTLLTSTFKKQAAAGTAAGTATAFATGGTSALAAAAGITAFAAAAGVTWMALDKLTNAVDTNTSAFGENSQVVNNHLKDLGEIAKATATANLQNRRNIQITTNLNKKTKEQVMLEATLAALRKKGLVPTTSLSKEGQDAINFEAVRLNLAKQGNLEEERRVNALIATYEAQMRLNEASQRYADILTVLTDAKISSEEVLVLAQKWGMTAGQVTEYIARIYAANTTDTTDAAIVKLYMAWGLTKEEAEKYVDFTRALKDEKIDTKEIETLMGKWGMTRAEVLAYAAQVQAGTVFSGTWDDPGKAAEQSWLDALAALNAYITTLKSIATGVTPGAVITQNPENPNIPIIPQTPPKEIPKSVQEQIQTLTDLRSTLTPGSALSFKLKEQIDELAAGTGTFSALGVDEQTKLRQMGLFDSGGIGATSSFDPGSFRMRENAGMTVNVTVQGSVTSENDLADTIRQKLLLEQQSGKPITYVSSL